MANLPKKQLNKRGKGAVCGWARSIIPAGGNLVPARQISHRIAIVGQAGVIPNVKHDIEQGNRP
ncbi:MAG: hypothetical protein GXP23_06515 [Gammaproteobacteria bacterium]|nr:hypothetical protein [Gammaproteobacteria bacterium]